MNVATDPWTTSAECDGSAREERSRLHLQLAQKIHETKPKRLVLKEAVIKNMTELHVCNHITLGSMNARLYNFAATLFNSEVMQDRIIIVNIYQGN